MEEERWLATPLEKPKPHPILFGMSAIVLGRDGLWLGNLKLDFGRQRFFVDPVRGKQEVFLKNRRFKFLLRREGNEEYLYAFGSRFLVEPRIKHRDLEDALGFTAPPQLEVCDLCHKPH